ncbi:MAG: hypothetical protein J5767_02735 [Paludibacteraceae bacterium]|nr:hypothetical protein [Paludibacteraceae bacterium]
MSKTLYLLILFIINYKAWNLRFITISDNNWLIIHLFYLIAGFLYYGRQESFSFLGENLKYWRWWVAGILISMLSAYFVYNQSFIQSIITYRWHILILQIPVLFKIAPAKENILKATMWFAAFLWVIYFIQLGNPYIIAYDDEVIERALKHNSVLLVPGMVFSAVPLFYCLNDIKENFNYKSVVIMFVCFLFLFFMQNRSMLFSVTVLVGWTILTIKHTQKWLMVFLMAVLVVIVAYNTLEVWNALFEETIGQVDDNDYNRNKAIQYFIFEASPNIWCYIFGNGFLSSHATSLMQDMMSLGVYNSDVGFIGYWNQFGVIPIIIFSLMLVPAVLRKNHSHFIRCWALQILLCSLTISYWGPSNILYMGLFYYLYYYDLKEESLPIEEQEIIET